MLKYIDLSLIMVITIIQITGCAADKKKPKIEADTVSIMDSDIRIITGEDNGKDIILSVGQNLIVDLDANPSTGYRWNIVENNEDLLPLVSQEFKQKEAPPGMVGVGGTLVLNFMAVEKGDFKLKLEYSRAMPSEEDKARFFEVDIKIE